MGLIKNLVTPNQTDLLADIFGDTASKSSKPADEQLMLMSHDPIALSWASYHLTVENPNQKYTELQSLTPSEQDIEMAEKTKKYYADRIAFQLLKGRPLSAFQTELYSLILGTEPMKKKHLGMVYRLPYFYTEDMARANMEQMFPVTPTVKNTTLHIEQTRRLVPAVSILKARRSSEIKEFWFRDEKDHPVLLDVPTNNPLYHLVESLYKKHNEDNPLCLMGFWNIRSHGDFMFWKVVKAQLV